jgi:hypothetical protein
MVAGEAFAKFISKELFGAQQFLLRMCKSSDEAEA